MSSKAFFHLDPVLNVGLDVNDNQVVDVWEMPLAQKFCPVLFAPKEDRGYLLGVGTTTLRPVPVEIMDRDGPNGQPDGILDYHDIEDSVYATSGNGALVGIYDMEDLTVFGAPFSNRYPDMILPYQRRNIDPPGAPGYANYVLIPHYEWATTNVPEDNVAWYAHWEQKMSAQATNTWYKHGTTYVGFDKNGNNTRINYMFHYPFNASAGRHEGDWEHINVVLNSQNPNTANITRVEYYFHEAVTVRYTVGVDYFLVSNTHPKVFVGGKTSFGGHSGEGTHGSYPLSGVWPDINPIGTDETVNGQGLSITFANYQNIVILPAVESVDIGEPLEWMTYAAFWGFPNSSPSGGEEFGLLASLTPLWSAIPWGQPWLGLVLGGISGALGAVGAEEADDTSLAPIGPAIKPVWEKVYNQTELTIYTKR